MLCETDVTFRPGHYMCHRCLSGPQHSSEIVAGDPVVDLLWQLPTMLVTKPNSYLRWVPLDVAKWWSLPHFVL